MTARDVPSFDEIQAMKRKLIDMQYQHWLHDDLFTFQWWLMIAITILYYTVWWKTVRKDKLVTVILFGSLVTVMSIILDDLGLQLFWWAYPHKLFPMMPPFLVFDMTHLPITFMWVMQSSSTWKQFLVRIALLSALLAFVVEPILVWLDIYRLIHWRYAYSFPTYILVAVFARATVIGIVRKQNKTRKS